MQSLLLALFIAGGIAAICLANGDDIYSDSGAPPLSDEAQSNGTKLISLNFANIETRKVLQIFAQFTGLNFLISDNVKGSLSVHFDQVPWQQALNVILRSQGLGSQRFGKIMIIAPINELASHEMQTLKADQELEKLKAAGKIQTLETEKKINDLEPLYNTIITLKYAKAEDIVKTLQSSASSLLSPRGQVSFDNRTNSIWIRTTLDQLYKVKQLVKRLDFPVKQVLIEARIVSIERPFEKQLGVRFGISAPTHLSGTLAGANQLAQGTTAPNVDPIANRLNFDIPAAPLFGRPWSVGLAVARLGGSTLLDLELSALEQEGKIQLVSTPSLVTSDNQPAYIKTGEEIPYQEATSSGATAVVYKSAELSLTVTPQIIDNIRVILTLTVSNNRRGTVVNLSGGGQAIPIRTEEEKSQVLVNNGQTIVLGGVYTQDKRKVLTRVPFLSNIPVVGALFRHNTTVNTRTELLIFLTPRIIERPSLNMQTPEQNAIWHQTRQLTLVKIPIKDRSLRRFNGSRPYPPMPTEPLYPVQQKPYSQEKTYPPIIPKKSYSAPKKRCRAVKLPPPKELTSQKKQLKLIQAKRADQKIPMP